MHVTKNYPREYKYTLGQKLKDEITELVVLIYRANTSTDKSAHVELILERIQVIQVMIRLSQDLRILPRKHYADLAEKTDSLGRQAQGWLKSLGKK
jgi:transposase-like protein